VRSTGRLRRAERTKCWQRRGAIRTAAALLVVAVVCSSCAGGHHAGTTPPRTVPGSGDWATYGHDAQHTFHGQTSLTPQVVPSLRQAWTFPTGDAVTATPTVVDGVVYEGSWDGYFYAVDLHTGALRWKFQLHAQPAVTPQQGAKVRDITSDGGMVTSSAWFEPAQGHQPDLVIFGGGYTLYALDAHTGQAVWWHDYTGRPDLPPDPVHDDTRIFSSPVVVGNKVIIGVSVDGEPNKRGYVVAASLETGDPDWVFDTDVDGRGQILNDGCGSVWSSGTVLPKLGAVVFDLADCHFGNPPPLSESVIALRINDGHLVWSYRPSRPDVRCDLDFGATANAGLSAAGQAVFLGVGAKDGTYYSLDPGTGRPRWSTNVVFGGFSGGFIATLAYDGRRVYGSTSIGDFGRFEHGTTVLCDPADPRDVAMQEPSAHAFDATTGGVVWQATNAASFGPTTVAGGMTFHGLILTPAVEVRDAATGTVLAHLSLPALCWSGIATVGDALVLGTGAPQEGSPDGIVVFTPDGRPPA
jgi:polyvinyl alcohol dehydrogenase (cytochrome)